MDFVIVRLPGAPKIAESAVTLNYRNTLDVYTIDAQGRLTTPSGRRWFAHGNMILRSQTPEGCVYHRAEFSHGFCRRVVRCDAIPSQAEIRHKVMEIPMDWHCVPTREIADDS